MTSPLRAHHGVDAVLFEGAADQEDGLADLEQGLNQAAPPAADAERGVGQPWPPSLPSPQSPPPEEPGDPGQPAADGLAGRSWPGEPGEQWAAAAGPGRGRPRAALPKPPAGTAYLSWPKLARSASDSALTCTPRRASAAALRPGIRAWGGGGAIPSRGPPPRRRSQSEPRAAAGAPSAPRPAALRPRRVFECPVCLEERALEDGFTLPSCQHSFCRDCLAGFLSSKISEAQVHALLCPCLEQDAGHQRCGEPIGDSEVRQLVQDDVYEKLHRFRTMRADPSYRECPRCCQPQVGGSKRRPAMTCSDCGSQFCFVHGDAHPPSVSCSEYERRSRPETKQAAKAISQIAWRCPGCRAPIERSGGCNHMRCSECHTEFCWLCGRNLNWCRGSYHVHYAPWNVFGCPGMQQTHVSKTCLFVIRCVVPLLLLLLLALWVLVLLPVAVLLLAAAACCGLWHACASCGAACCGLRRRRRGRSGEAARALCECAVRCAVLPCIILHG